MAKDKVKRRCCQTYWSGNIWTGSVQCTSNGKIEVDGKWYCGTHDPAKVEAKRIKREQDWKAKHLQCKRVERQKECAASMAVMAPLVLRVLQGVATPEQASFISEQWGHLVAASKECGLIAEDSK